MSSDDDADSIASESCLTSNCRFLYNNQRLTSGEMGTGHVVEDPLGVAKFAQKMTVPELRSHSFTARVHDPFSFHSQEAM